jgi:hypothetical protein
MLLYCENLTGAHGSTLVTTTENGLLMRFGCKPIGSSNLPSSARLTRGFVRTVRIPFVISAELERLQMALSGDALLQRGTKAAMAIIAPVARSNLVEAVVSGSALCCTTPAAQRPVHTVAGVATNGLEYSYLNPNRP